MACPPPAMRFMRTDSMNSGHPIFDKTKRGNIDMKSRVGQYCINVTDLERSARFYSEVMGLEIQQRIEIPGAKEIVLGAKGSDGKIQLAQQLDRTGPINHGDALWKLYIYTDDCRAVYDAALAFGCQSQMEPQVLEEWNVTVAFITDPDGYAVEIVQSHASDTAGAKH
jgi:lactoylglutathione lyase